MLVVSFGLGILVVAAVLAAGPRRGHYLGHYLAHAVVHAVSLEICAPITSRRAPDQSLESSYGSSHDALGHDTLLFWHIGKLGLHDCHWPLQC